MVTKLQTQNTSVKDEKTRRVRIGQLKLNKETIKDLTTGEAKIIRGGGCHSTYALAGGNGKGGGTLT